MIGGSLIVGLPGGRISGGRSGGSIGPGSACGGFGPKMHSESCEKSVRPVDGDHGGGGDHDGSICPHGITKTGGSS